MQEGVDFPKLPPGAVFIPAFSKRAFCVDYIAPYGDAFPPFIISDSRLRLIIGYTMAGQWEELIDKYETYIDKMHAELKGGQWRKWARGEEWK